MEHVCAHEFPFSRINCLACTLQKFYTKNHCDDEDDDDVLCWMSCEPCVCGEKMWSNNDSKYVQIKSFDIVWNTNTLVSLFVILSECAHISTLFHSKRFALCVCVREWAHYGCHHHRRQWRDDGDNIIGSTLVLKFRDVFIEIYAPHGIHQCFECFACGHIFRSYCFYMLKVFFVSLFSLIVACLPCSVCGWYVPSCWHFKHPFNCSDVHFRYVDSEI